MIYLPFIFGVLKKFRSFVEITKLRKKEIMTEKERDTKEKDCSFPLMTLHKEG